MNRESEYVGQQNREIPLPSKMMNKTINRALGDR